jgi:hypothetical protein
MKAHFISVVSRDGSVKISKIQDLELDDEKFEQSIWNKPIVEVRLSDTERRFLAFDKSYLEVFLAGTVIIQEMKNATRTDTA